MARPKKVKRDATPIFDAVVQAQPASHPIHQANRARTFKTSTTRAPQLREQFGAMYATTRHDPTL